MQPKYLYVSYTSVLLRELLQNAQCSLGVGELEHVCRNFAEEILHLYSKITYHSIIFLFV